jgi:hypothetical protein
MGWSAIVFVVSATAAAVLVASGWAKLRQPGPLLRVLRAIRVPGHPHVVRAFSAAELGVGLACLLHPGRPELVALGALYAGFALFLGAVLVLRIEIPSCGCAAEDVPPSWVHVLLDAVAAAAALGSAAGGSSGEPILKAAWALPVHGLGFVAGVAILAGLAVVAANHLPVALFAYRGRRR